MSNNVAQKISDPEMSPVIDGDGQRNLFDGQKQPAPFLHDPAAIHDASPAYYLMTDALATLMSHLQNIVSGRGPMQVIIAEHGRGKSSLIRQLITEAGNRWLLCHIHADYHLGVDHIINGLGQTFFPQERVDFESLVHGLASYGHQEPYPVVIVDDAQNISSYALETLANIKRAVTEQGGDIDIILCASPALRKTLASYGMSPFKTRWFEVHALPRFTEEDTIAYLKNNFENAADDLFTPSQLQIIHRRSCGIPACINYHAELALGRTVSDERLRLEHQQMLQRQKKMPYFIGGAAAVLLVLVVIILSVTSSEQNTVIDEPRVASTAAPVVDISPPVLKTAVAKVVDKKPTPTPVTKKSEVKKPVVVVKAKPAPKSAPKSKPAQVKTQAKPAVKKIKAAAVTKPKPVVKAVPVVARPKPDAVIKKAEVKIPENKQPVVKKTVAQKTASPVGAADDETIPGAAWLKAQSPENFTIQLAGSPDEKNIIRYITRSSLDGELAYVLLERKNRSSWYVVLHGSFKSRAAARDVVEFFPPELRKNKPWIRKFSRLQNALDEN